MGARDNKLLTNNILYHPKIPQNTQILNPPKTPKTQKIKKLLQRESNPRPRKIKNKKNDLGGNRTRTLEKIKNKKNDLNGNRTRDLRKHKNKKMTSAGLEPQTSTHTKIKKDLRRNRTPHLKPENPITNFHCAKDTLEKIKHVLP